VGIYDTSILSGRDIPKPSAFASAFGMATYLAVDSRGDHIGPEDIY
jgi:hypothetical protein